jgi:predicted amidohydrolase YtcJ
MKKTTLTILLLVAGFPTLGFSQQVSPLVAQQGYADSILVNGKIVTLDDRSDVPNTPGTIVQAMAIKGKKIMALGTDAAMRQLAGPNTRFVDMGNRTVIPGLINVHYHTYGGATRRYGPEEGLTDPSIKLNVVAETTAEGTAKKLHDTIVNAIRVQDIPPGKWITVGLTDNKDNKPNQARSWLYLGQINRRQIDTGTENNPVLISMGIQGIFNSTAVEMIKEVFGDWEESTDLENRPGAGRDGYAAVPEIGGLTFEYWWKDEPDYTKKLAEALRKFGEDQVKRGLTTIGTRIVYPSVVAAYNLLNREGKMPHRLAYYIESQRGNFWNLKTIREFYKGYGAPWTTHSAGGEMLWLNGMCNEIWDSVAGEVCMGPDMPNASAETKARERCPSPGTKPWESYKEAIIHGWRPAQAHGTSSHGARLYIQMLEQAMEEGNYSLEYMRGLRTTLEHNILLGAQPDVIAGIKKFGIIINVNTPMLGGVPGNITVYGEELRKYAMPVKTWIDEGIRVTFEGAPNWRPIHTLVTREVIVGDFGVQRPEGQPPEVVVLLPEQGVDRVTALKMTTTWAAEYLFAEDTIGSLEPGKYADFVVLDRDFFTIPVDDILDLKVVATGLNGKFVYDLDQIAGDN